MMRKDVNKPKGKTSAYAFFVQTCREEHRKKNPEQSVNFAEFSKKCSERWKVRAECLVQGRAVLGPNATGNDNMPKTLTCKHSLNIGNGLIIINYISPLLSLVFRRE